MSRINTLRQELTRIIDKEAAAHKKLASYSKDANKHWADAAKHNERALKSKNASTQSSHLRQVKSSSDHAAKAEKSVADAKKELGDLAKKKTNTQNNLEAAEKAERDKISRQVTKDRRAESAHVRQMASLRSRTLRIAAPKPEALRVLYLTTNPEMLDGAPLRTDAEVRQVQNELRAARHRDQVVIHHRPAATFEDMLNGMNDIRPHVIHFSGHGGKTGILFDNGSVDKPKGVGINFDKLAKLLEATDDPPRLLVLNACDTLDGCEVLLDAVPAIVAMSDSITDTAAVVFASKFYAAIASAQSVGTALKQAQVMLSMMDSAEDHLPNCVARNDVDIDGLILVTQ